MWLYCGEQVLNISLTKGCEENTFYDSDFYTNQREATTEKAKFYMGLTSDQKTSYSEA